MKKTPTIYVACSFILAITLSLSSCNSTKTEETASTVETVPGGADPDPTISDRVIDQAQGAQAIQPSGAKPDWAPEMQPQMQAVIEELGSMNGKPIEQLSAQEARQQPTPADAVMALMQENNMPMPPAKVDTMGRKIPVSGGQNVHARIYTPKSGSGPFPVIVYYHGGGWVIAGIDTYNASAKSLAEKANAIVVAPAYRQGPENKFPTAHNDAYAVYEWVLKNAASFKGDPKNVAVVGESAGGNLAANVSIMARDKKAMLPVHQVLVYPIANNDMNSPSYQKYANAKPLNKPMMSWFMDKYLPNKNMSSDPRIALVNANLKGLPPTTIINAQLDPLQSEGELLAEKLRAAGVTVDQKTYDGVTHEFFGMAAVVPPAEEAQAKAVSALQQSFNK